jgi:hypothetical protein
MKYIVYILLIGSLVFGNDELNSYLNNKNLQNQIIKDDKNKRIIIDLLYEENRIIIFNEYNYSEYKKTFDEKVYFCNKGVFSNPMIVLINAKINIVCSLPNVENGVSYEEYYQFENFSTLDDILLSIEKRYLNNDDNSIKKDYIFKPQKDIPTLKNYTDENFSEDYLDKNYKEFKKINKKIIHLTKQPLYSEPQIKTKMYLVKGDKVEILEEKDDWLYILYKGKKDIKAWIPKSAVEYK